ncbi:MAG: sulfite exporter TauE/SafE family protein [Leptonema sp. (in: Bacteria)]|nr:sulfite exporter TauE/SafE family protein [Leptonema sp. (in: bacteria)]
MFDLNETGLIFGAFTTGLLSGFGHCILMCGPLISTTVVDRSRQTFTQKSVAQLLYHIGRITTYGWVGALMGFTGSFVNVAGHLAGIQNVAAGFAGLFMIGRGLEVSGIVRFQLLARLESKVGFMIQAVRPVQFVDSIWRYYLIGLFLGLIPCGLSYSIFLGAAGMGNIVSGFLFSFLFGLGTVPALFILGSIVSVGSLSLSWQTWLYRIGGLFLAGLGVLFLYRAFGWLIKDLI